MQINSINSGVHFKSKVIVDIGGSVKENSCKINVLSNDGKDSFIKDKTIVNDSGMRNYNGNDDFLTKLSSRIKPYIVKLQGMDIPDYEKDVNEMVFFVPGYAFDNKLIYADNIRGKDLKGSESIDFNKISNKMRGFVTDDVKIRVLQDSMGTGLFVAKVLHDKGMLTKGSHYAVAITGGGCGISNIRAVDDDRAIVDASGSSYFTNTQGIIKIANMGASAPVLIKNFCNAFNINKSLGEEISKFGVGQMVTMEKFTLPKNEEGQKLKQILYKTGKYDFEGNTVKVKSEYEKDYQHARFYAIEHYADALARFGIIKENEGANALIVTGPLGMAIDKIYKSMGKKGLGSVIEQKMVENYNTRELDEIKRYHGFTVICDDDFKLEDNTECRDLILNSEFAGDNRYNWVELNFD